MKKKLTPKLLKEKLAENFRFLVEDHDFAHDKTWTVFESDVMIIEIHIGHWSVGVGFYSKENKKNTSLAWYLMSKAIEINPPSDLVENIDYQASLLKEHAPVLLSGDLNWISSVVKFKKKHLRRKR